MGLFASNRFLLVGTSNAVNLTDGLDGLLAGTSAVAFGAYAILAYNQHQYETAIFCVAVVGAVLGFFWCLMPIQQRYLWGIPARLRLAAH
ncbi:hypothetical protein GCM10020331_045610 [Ectobacillus funiculus]